MNLDIETKDEQQCYAKPTDPWEVLESQILNINLDDVIVMPLKTPVVNVSMNAKIET